MSDDGFFAHWSRRKVAAREGVLPQAEDAHAVPAPAEAPPTAPVTTATAPDRTTPATATPIAADAPPPPTLADVDQLTPGSDFTRFVARNVAPEVRNAALKKLFADPRFNVMDGLDVYIGDYTQSVPLSEGTIRRMAVAGALGLFRPVQEDTDGAARAPVPESDAALSNQAPEPTHEDADLQLQQDDADPGREPGSGTG